MTDPSPLEVLRARLALAVGNHAVFDGWTVKAVASAATQLGINLDQAGLAMPKDASGLIDSYAAAIDAAMTTAFPPERIQAMKIRERIRSLVWFRIESMAEAREAVRRGLAILAMPQNAPLAARIGWRSCDAMWRLAGDTATDFNFYTKRMTLGAVYASTLVACSTTRPTALPIPPLSSTGGSTTSCGSKNGRPNGAARRSTVQASAASSGGSAILRNKNDCVRSVGAFRQDAVDIPSRCPIAFGP